MIGINRATVGVRVRQMFRVKSVLAAFLFLAGNASDALASGSISGQITSAATHTGIAGATVQFYNLNANEVSPPTAIADSNGNYTKTLPDGSYGVLTQNTQGYINKAW